MKESLIFVSNKPLNRVYSGKSACWSLQIKYQKSNLHVNLFSLLSLSTSTGRQVQPKKWELGVSGHAIELVTKALIVGTMGSLSGYNVAPTPQRTVLKIQCFSSRTKPFHQRYWRGVEKGGGSDRPRKRMSEDGEKEEKRRKKQREERRERKREERVKGDKREKRKKKDQVREKKIHRHSIRGEVKERGERKRGREIEREKDRERSLN